MAAKSFQVALDAAANETNTEENWDRILEVCDFVRNGQVKSNELLDQIIKRLKQSRKPRLQLNTLTLFDAAVKNCGQQFHQLFTSRATMNTLVEIVEDSRTENLVRNRIGSLLKQWVEDPEFKDKPQYAMLGATYKKLTTEKGYNFIDGASGLSIASGTTSGTSSASRKVQDDLLAKREEEEFAKAIALSMQEANQTKSHGLPSSSSTAPASIYPMMQTSNATAPVASPAVNGHEKKAKALYDFEAAEDNEVTFKAGDILIITDDSDQHWWKGVNNGVEGLFPANFVTKNLQQPVETSNTTSTNLNKKTDEMNQNERQSEIPRDQVVIDEQLIDRCLAMLQNADPTGELEPDSNEMLTLEDTCYAMGPLIDHELEKVDRKHVQLEDLNRNLREAMDLYHRLMEEGRLRTAQVKSSTASQLAPNQMYQPQMPPQPNFYSMHPGLSNQPGMVPPPQGLTQPMMYPSQAPYNTMPPQTQSSMPYVPTQAPAGYYVDPNSTTVPNHPMMYSMPPNMMNHHMQPPPTQLQQPTTYTETQ